MQQFAWLELAAVPNNLKRQGIVSRSVWAIEREAIQYTRLLLKGAANENIFTDMPEMSQRHGSRIPGHKGNGSWWYGVGLPHERLG